MRRSHNKLTNVHDDSIAPIHPQTNSINHLIISPTMKVWHCCICILIVHRSASVVSCFMCTSMQPFDAFQVLFDTPNKDHGARKLAELLSPSFCGQCRCSLRQRHHPSRKDVKFSFQSMVLAWWNTCIQG